MTELGLLSQRAIRQLVAASSDVLVSGTVKNLVFGSGIEFHDRGEYALKGVPGSWKLFAVEP